MPLAWRDGGIRAYQNHHSQVPVAIASRESITANCHLTVEFLFLQAQLAAADQSQAAAAQQQQGAAGEEALGEEHQSECWECFTSVWAFIYNIWRFPLRRHRRSTPRSWPSSISSQVAAPPPWCRRHNSPPALRISRAAPGTLSRMRRPGWSCRRPWSPSRSRTWLPTDRPHLPRTPRRARPIWWVSKPVGDL